MKIDYEKVKLDSPLWHAADQEDTGRYFVDLGFRNVKEILDLRFYDLLNMDTIDNNRAEEMLISLYRLLNYNPVVDEGIINFEIEQPFSYTAWNKKYGPASKVKVRDLVLAEGLNIYVLYRIFDRVTRNFYRSDEYKGRFYRYASYADYRKQNRKEMKNEP